MENVQYIDGRACKWVRDIAVGDLLDLERDAYCDPEGENTAFEYEYAEVISVHTFTDHSNVYYVETDMGTFQLPGDHLIDVPGEE